MAVGGGEGGGHIGYRSMNSLSRRPDIFFQQLCGTKSQNRENQLLKPEAKEKRKRKIIKNHENL